MGKDSENKSVHVESERNFIQITKVQNRKILCQVIWKLSLLTYSDNDFLVFSQRIDSKIQSGLEKAEKLLGLNCIQQMMELKKIWVAWPQSYNNQGIVLQIEKHV